MTTLYDYKRILAVHPSPRGFGFAVLEVRGLLAAWGVAQLSSNAEDEFGARLEGLMDKYRPSLVVAEDFSGTKHGERARDKVEYGLRVAHLRDVQVSLLSRGDVRHALGLSQAASNHDVALVVANIFPELGQHLPRKRRAWEGVDERAYLFRAVALALVVHAGGTNSVNEFGKDIKAERR